MEWMGWILLPENYLQNHNSADMCTGNKVVLVLLVSDVQVLRILVKIDIKHTFTMFHEVSASSWEQNATWLLFGLKVIKKIWEFWNAAQWLPASDLLCLDSGLMTGLCFKMFASDFLVNF